MALNQPIPAILITHLNIQVDNTMLDNTNMSDTLHWSISFIRSFFLGLIIVVPMACAAGPLANTEARAVPDFNKIEVGGLVNVKIEHGDKAKIEVRAYGIDMQDIITEVNNNTLLLTTKGSHSGESILITVIYTDLVALKTSGAATLKTNGAIQAESIAVEITNAGDANLELDVNTLMVDMRGNGNLRLAGRVVSQSITSHGGGGSLSNADLIVTGDPS
jgi:hypothetical protein